jgi:hypothetical protein
MNHLETALLQSEGELEKLQVDFDEQQLELEQSHRLQRQTEKKLKQSEKRCQQQETVIETLRAQLREEHNIKCIASASSRDDLQILADELAKVQRELAISDEDAARFEDEANQAEDECEKVTKTLKKIRKRVKDLESDLDSALDTNDDLREQLEDRAEDINEEFAAREKAENKVAELERQLVLLKAGVQEHLKTPSPTMADFVTGTKDNGCSCNSNKADRCDACEAIRPAEICLSVEDSVVKSSADKGCVAEIKNEVKRESRSATRCQAKRKVEPPKSNMRRYTKGPAAPPMPPIPCSSLEATLSYKKSHEKTTPRDDDSWITPRDEEVREGGKTPPPISPALDTRGSPENGARMPVSARRIFGTPKVFAVGVE